jgi:selenide,water dikinase
LAGATDSMLRLSRHASHLAREAGLSAATDVTGFGLVGHLWEMAERSGVAVWLDAGRVPLLLGARECSAMGVHTGGEGRNREWVGENAAIAPSVDPEIAALLFDPQTSGGLLLAASPERAVAMEAAFRRDGEPLYRIGVAGEGVPAIRVE